MLTIGNLLKKAREHSKKDIKEIAQYLKIKPRYLEKIEANDFSDFQSSTYVKGFIRSYASYLGLDAENIVALFRRQIGEEETPLKTKKIIKPKSSIVISPANMISGVVILFFIGLFSFLIVQFYNLQQPPALEITSPEELVSTVEKASFQIKGVTEKNAVVTINNTQIELREDSTFAYNIELREGINTYKIEAWKENIEGKRAEKVIQITYKVKNSNLQTTSTTNNNSEDEDKTVLQNSTTANSIKVQLSLTGDAWLKVIEDRKQKVIGVKNKGFTFSATPSESLEIITGVPEVSNALINEEKFEWRIAKGIGYLECNVENGDWECK